MASIEFGGSAEELFERDAIGFRAIVDGQSLGCVITYDALFERYGVKRMQGFLANRADVEKLAKEMIEQGRVRNGELLIASRSRLVSTPD